MPLSRQDHLVLFYAALIKAEAEVSGSDHVHSRIFNKAKEIYRQDMSPANLERAYNIIKTLDTSPAQVERELTMKYSKDALKEVFATTTLSRP